MRWETDETSEENRLPAVRDDVLAALERARNDVREGRFGRSLSLIAAGASLMSGLEVGYEHYRGSYSQRIMYTPVILSGVLCSAGIAGFFDRGAARTALRAASALTLADALVGFFFHVRGIARKPGGWRLPVTNIIMGPPIFAPLLFGTAAYLGLIASYLRREDAPSKRGGPSTARPAPPAPMRGRISIEQDLREGRFQRHMLIATALSASLCGFEAWYSHAKSDFRYRVQWAPVFLAPLLAIASLAATRSRTLARTAVPLLSVIAMAVAGVGFFYHARGVLRRPGGSKYLVYNIVYGPPIFAPLLFGAAGSLGLLASQLRRSDT